MCRTPVMPILVRSAVVIFLGGLGPLDFRGTGIIYLTPPTSGTYAGVTIFQGRTNTTASKINGTNNLHIAGTLYFPSANVVLSGNGDGFGNQIIALTISLSGNASININYNGAFPNNTNRVWLVK